MLRLFIVGLALLLVACGENPLADLGDRSSGWLSEAEISTTIPTTTSSTTIPLERLFARAADAVWLTDREVAGAIIGIEEMDARAETMIRAVWERTQGNDRFVQASRDEIALALPRVAFPTLVPEAIEHITSQLLFIPGVPVLADDFVAAFGFWSVEPYTVNRINGQRAVLWVARASAEGFDCTTPYLAEFDDCRDVPLAAGPAWWVENADGARMIWFDDEYRYELFDRRSQQDIAIRVAESASPLSALEASPPLDVLVSG